MSSPRAHVCVRVNNTYTADLRVRRAAETLAAAGYRITVVADRDRAGRLPVRETLEGVDVVRHSKTSRVPFRSLVDAISATGADIIHAHDVDSLLPAVLAARRMGPATRIVYDSHELWSAHARDKVHARRRALVALEGRLLRRCDALITASPLYTEEIVREYGYAGRTQTILNVPRYWTDAELTPSWEERDRSSARIVTAVSVFQHGRGAVPLVRSLQNLPKDVRVRLVGPFPQRDYEALVRETAAPFGERVELAGSVEPGEIVPTLAASHLSAVLIEPISRSYELTSPNKLYESLMAGTAIIGSRYGVIRDVVEQEDAGVVCDPRDPEAIAGAVLEALGDRERLAANARRAATRYNWDRERDKLLELFEWLASGADRR
ncbi:MAG: glycosyltransferase family 4 protein [Coriobacteriia bacterium]